MDSKASARTRRVVSEEQRGRAEGRAGKRGRSERAVGRPATHARGGQDVPASCAACAGGRPDHGAEADRRAPASGESSA